MKPLLRLLPFLKLHRRRILAAFACGVLVAVLTACLTLLMQPLLDDVFIRKDRTMLLMIPMALVVIGILKGFAAYGQSYLWGYIGLAVVRDIRQGLYRRLILLPIGFHNKHPVGSLMTSILNDVQLIQMAVSTATKTVVQQPLTLITLAMVVFYKNFQLALMAILVIPLFIIPLVRMGARLRKTVLSGQENMALLSSHLQETLSGIRVVKAFRKEPFESDRFEKKNALYFRDIRKAMGISEVAAPMIEAFNMIGLAAIIGYAGLQVMNGTLTAGAFFSFMTAVALMYAPLKTLGWANIFLQQAGAASERIWALWDEQGDLERDGGHREITKSRGELTFEHVSFTYDGADEAALTDIHLSIKQGTVVAFVGHSGAGKSSLINLIPRFYEPTTGVIRLEGIPLSEIKLESLRRQIGIVSQDVILFDETLGWNIAYGSKNPSPEEIVRAAEAAYAHLFISKLPKGYETWIGKGGNTLSGGERQRLAIARALLANPPILILDEATSALDSESELYVQKALINLMANRTTLVIAHRLSTVVNADCIVVMEKGRIVEMGRHEELIQKEGPYKRVYQMQFASQTSL